ncbi:MAG: acyl-ACP--UDP-N-acetylglucosamine O-acyltransferase [Candidatus Gygaella obscura]|nr:acyl-ACP--UDP-N-acetylglucosamine O-acyltransferase [Candidatus Gygaella obscura]
MIDKTAIVSKKAKLGSFVTVGAFSIIGDGVEIGSNVQIGNHCNIIGNTSIGDSCKILTGAVVGSIPQDLKYKGEKSFLNIGNKNIIREYVTINPGTSEGSSTRIGNDNLFMAYSHVAHDCKVGNNCTIANSGTLAGHVVIEDCVVIGGLAAIHQFCRIGKFSIIGGCSKVVQDVIPFSMCDGNPARICGINLVGLRRSGFNREEIIDIKKSIKLLFFSGHVKAKALVQIKDSVDLSENIGHLIDFVQSSQRGLCRSKKE